MLFSISKQAFPKIRCQLMPMTGVISGVITTNARICCERVSMLVLHFKKDFHQKYLAKLLERQLDKSRKFNNSCSVNVGDVVLIKD